ncbi:MAG TPA: hypothetical protein VNL13_02860 [Sulfolobales archaeon]|nr:hypothetical protein [Sulfolobales archaeon]
MKRSLAIVVDECYANKCLFEKLLDSLEENLRKNIEKPVRHKDIMGRDRVIRAITNISKMYPNHMIIAVIDYEEGPSRSYIDENFELEQVEQGIYVGHYKRNNAIRAIIFDPNIEEAIICRSNESSCREPGFLRRLKSKEACENLDSIFKKQGSKELLNKLAEAVKKLFTHNIVQ